uniref:Uncharacterized protein n=1 Tax=Chelonoidis abingdonii TaxID=106734 RepID=A0A8C0FVX4_CHEAB
SDPGSLLEQMSVSGSFECHYSIWGLLAFMTMALIVSLVINISYCIANKQKATMMIILKNVQFMATSIRRF